MPAIDPEMPAKRQRFTSGWSDSKIEEVIACLWTIVWLLSLTSGLPVWVVWAVGIKAASDHLMAIAFALERR